MSKKIKKISEIESIESYSSAWEAITENSVRKLANESGFNEDDIIFLKHFDDYEDAIYYVINYEYVLPTVGGDVNGNELMTMDEFIDSVLELLAEDRDER